MAEVSFSLERYNSEFAVKLREEFAITAKDVKDLADYLGCSVQAINQYKQGQALPKIENLIKIAKFYDCSLDYLIGLSDVKKPDANIKAVCEYTGLNERAVEKLHWYTSTHENHEENGKAISGILNHSEFYAVLKALKRASETDGIWKAAGKPVITSETPFLNHDDKTGDVIINAGAAKVFYEDYARRELSLIVRSIVNGLSGDTEELKGW